MNLHFFGDCANVETNIQSVSLSDEEFYVVDDLRFETVVGDGDGIEANLQARESIVTAGVGLTLLGYARGDVQDADVSTRNDSAGAVSNRALQNSAVDLRKRRYGETKKRCKEAEEIRGTDSGTRHFHTFRARSPFKERVKDTWGGEVNPERWVECGWIIRTTCEWR